MQKKDAGELAHRWLDEVWNRKNDAAVDSLLADDAVGHSCGSIDMSGKQAFRAYRDGLFQSFAQLIITPEETLVQGNQAVVRWRIRATPKATGEEVEFWGMTWFRFDNGRLAEGWDAWDQDGLTQRLQGAAA